ncbi:MAG: hypothetical protein ACK55I_25070, partial [bacterium]
MSRQLLRTWSRVTSTSVGSLRAMSSEIVLSRIRLLRWLHRYPQHQALLRDYPQMRHRSRFSGRRRAI